MDAIGGILLQSGAPVVSDLLLLGPVDGLILGNVGGIFVDTLMILVMMLAPFVAFALVIHWLEYMTQHRMAERFGWKSVMWTGWLGTPIHELSHAFMCWVFKHKVEEIALFEPDRESGRLGFVRHTFKTGNWFQEMGNLFIGVAPLLGGSVALAGLMWLFYPDAAQQAIELSKVEGGSLMERGVAVVWAMMKSVLVVSNFATPRFWVFIYLVLCVGSHMAPSPSDYHGASRGVFIVGAILLGGAFLLALAGTDAQEMGAGMIATMGPLFAIFGLTVVLCSIAAVIVYAVTSFFPQRFRVG